jgi:hypothetical protein
MAFTKDGYTLYSRQVTLKGGRQQTIYFFAKGKPKSGNPTELPNGYEVATTTRTGLPILRRKGGSKWREQRAEAKKRAAERKARREEKRKQMMAERKARAQARREAARARKEAAKAKKAKAKAKKVGKKGKKTTARRVVAKKGGKKSKPKRKGR